MVGGDKVKIFGLAGWSGSGKTTLMEKLVGELTQRGFKVSTVKHTHHDVDVDRPGKDSYRHREAGAVEVLVTSSRRWALMHELRGDEEPSVEELSSHMTAVDLLLIEGFKAHRHAKLEVHRPSLGKPMLWPEDPQVLAVASDEPLPGVTLPTLPLADATAVADFILAATGLAQPPRHSATPAAS